MANTFKFGNGEWAVGKETALAYNDENSNFKPLPFTFDRGSIGTVVNKQGLIETVGTDEPRIDFLNNTKGHLLLEPSRSNLVTNSEQFVDAPTGNTNMDLFSGTITNNNTTSPDGNVKGMKFTISSGSGAVLRIYQSDLSTSANTTFSIYAKKGTTDSLSINIAGGTATIATLNDKWQRFSTTDTSSGSKFLDVEISGNAGEYIYIFGIQAEQGSYATSYIPTSGSAVTRSVDFTKIVNSPILQGTNQFTLFFEAKDFLIVNGTNVSFSNVMLVFGAGESAYDSGTGIHIYNRTWYYYNGSSAVNIGVCYNGLVDSKFAISYDGTKFTRYAGGIKLGEFVTSASMVNWDTITTGANTDVENDDRVFNLSDLRLYNTALTDAELIALTS